MEVSRRQFLKFLGLAPFAAVAIIHAPLESAAEPVALVTAEGVNTLSFDEQKYLILSSWLRAHHEDMFLRHTPFFSALKRKHDALV